MEENHNSISILKLHQTDAPQQQLTLTQEQYIHFSTSNLNNK